MLRLYHLSCQPWLPQLRRLFFLGHGLCASLWLLLTFAHVCCGAAGFDHVGSTCPIVRCQLRSALGSAVDSAGPGGSAGGSSGQGAPCCQSWSVQRSPVVPSVVTVPGFPTRPIPSLPVVFWVRRVGWCSRSALAGRGYPHKWSRSLALAADLPADTVGA